MNTLIVNISEAKANLSKYATLIKQGGAVILAERNIPFARILPLEKTSEEITRKRKNLTGSLKGKVKIIGDINQPLTEKELKDWYGKAL